MRKNIFFVLSVSILFFSNILVAQEDTPHIFAVTTFEAKNPTDGSWAQFDSLQQLYTDKVTLKNKNVISQRCVRHLYGSDSRQLIYITEYKSMEAMLASSDEDTKLFREAWSTKEERAAFNKLNSKYFGHHSDEIYSEIKSGRK